MLNNKKIYSRNDLGLREHETNFHVYYRKITRFNSRAVDVMILLT